MGNNQADVRYHRYGAADDAFGGPMRNISLAGQRVTLPADIEDAGDAEIRLAGGVVAWIDRESREVHVVGLSPGKETVVGRAHPEGQLTSARKFRTR